MFIACKQLNLKSLKPRWYRPKLGKKIGQARPGTEFAFCFEPGQARAETFISVLGQAGSGWNLYFYFGLGQGQECYHMGWAHILKSSPCRPLMWIIQDQHGLLNIHCQVNPILYSSNILISSLLKHRMKWTSQWI